MCVYCESQPDDESPCPCAHAPCIHDRNTTNRKQYEQLAAAETQVRVLDAERNAALTSLVDGAAAWRANAVTLAAERDEARARIERLYADRGDRMLVEADLRAAADALAESVFAAAWDHPSVDAAKRYLAARGGK